MIIFILFLHTNQSIRKLLFLSHSSGTWHHVSSKVLCKFSSYFLCLWCYYVISNAIWFQECPSCEPFIELCPWFEPILGNRPLDWSIFQNTKALSSFFIWLQVSSSFRYPNLHKSQRQSYPLPDIDEKTTICRIVQEQHQVFWRYLFSTEIFQYIFSKILSV